MCRQGLRKSPVLFAHFYLFLLISFLNQLLDLACRSKLEDSRSRPFQWIYQSVSPVFLMYLHQRSHPQQLLLALSSNLLGPVQSVWPATHPHSGRGEPKLFCCRVLGRLTLLLRYISLSSLHCDLLSLSRPLTGSGGWGLVPATYCDMFTKRAGTSRFQEIHRKKGNVSGKRGFYCERWRPLLLSAALCCWRKASRFPPLYLMERSTSSLQPLLPPSGVGQIFGAELA